MIQNQWTDKEIINGIKDDNTHEATLRSFFKDLGWRDDAISMAMGYGATKEDAEEVAVDALLGLSKNVRNNKFDGKAR
jgi:hypothetical protein